MCHASKYMFDLVVAPAPTLFTITYSYKQILTKTLNKITNKWTLACSIAFVCSMKTLECNNTHLRTLMKKTIESFMKSSFIGFPSMPKICLSTNYTSRLLHYNYIKFVHHRNFNCIPCSQQHSILIYVNYPNQLQNLLYVSSHPPILWWKYYSYLTVNISKRLIIFSINLILKILFPIDYQLIATIPSRVLLFAINY